MQPQGVYDGCRRRFMAYHTGQCISDKIVTVQVKQANGTAPPQVRSDPATGTSLAWQPSKGPAHARTDAPVTNSPLSVHPVRLADATASGVSLSTILSMISKSIGAFVARMTRMAALTSSGPILTREATVSVARWKNTHNGYRRAEPLSGGCYGVA